MNTNDLNILKSINTPKICEVINYILTNDLSDDFDIKKIYSEFLSYKKIFKYTTLFFFKEFYILKYFNKFIIFSNDTDYTEIIQKNSNETLLKTFINKNAIGLILNETKVSNTDFYNLKKCYMLTEAINYMTDGTIYCKYKPYYIIELTLKDNMLDIYIKETNSICTLNMNNIEDDLKTFLNKIFSDMDNNSLKMYHQILKYYASLT